MHSSCWCKNCTYLCGMTTYTVSCKPVQCRERIFAEIRVYLSPWYRVCTKALFISKGSCRNVESKKCIPLVGAKTAHTCTGQQTAPSHVSQYRAENGKLRKTGCTYFTMVPCLHQINVYITRKLQVWTVQKCIRLVGAKTALTCLGRQPTPSHASQYSVQNVNLRKSRSTFRHGTVFAPKHCLYQKEAAEMQSVKNAFLQSVQKAHLPVRDSKQPRLMLAVYQYRAENGDLRKSGSSFRHGSVLVPKECLYQKEATRMESLKSIPLLGAKTALTSSGRQTTPSRVSQYRAENGNLRKNGCTFFTMVPCLHERNAYMKRKLEVWRVLKCIPLVENGTYQRGTANYPVSCKPAQGRERKFAEIRCQRSE